MALDFILITQQAQHAYLILTTRAKSIASVNMVVRGMSNLLIFLSILSITNGFGIGSLTPMNTAGVAHLYTPSSSLVVLHAAHPQQQEGHDNESDTGSNSKLLSTLLSRFQGDFDNYNQVFTDRQANKFPREGGGHEHFHVTLIPLPVHFLPDALYPIDIQKDETTCGAVVAAYYFDGMPNRIFRLRMYTLYSTNGDGDGDGDVDQVYMKLYTFDPVLEGKLRQDSEISVQKWPSLIEEHVLQAQLDAFTELKRCDIQWTEQPDVVRHSYLTKFTDALPQDDCIDPVHAIMMNDHEQGGVLLESQMMPGSFIRIQDELSLWGDELWINDRGHDADSKNMVYGNWDEVPYQMKRVATLERDEGVESDVDVYYKRKIVDENLSWTVGAKFRTAEEYEAKMAAVGGVTTKMNQKQAKK